MQIMLLVNFLEDHLGAEIPIEEVAADNFETPAAIAALAQRLGREPAA